MWIQHKEIHTGHMRFRNCRCCEHNVLPLVCSKHSTSLGETPTQPGEGGFLKPKVLTSAQRHERTINFTSAKEASNFTRLFWYATLVKRLCKSNHRRTKKKGLATYKLQREKNALELRLCQRPGHTAEVNRARFLPSISAHNQSLVRKEKSALISLPKTKNKQNNNNKKSMDIPEHSPWSMTLSSC